ncbi:MAG: FAD-dependent protein [Pseudomonadota bacterium]
MLRLSELKLDLSALPEPAASAAGASGAVHPLAALRALAAQALELPEPQIAHLQVHKRSFDARSVQLRVVYVVDLELTDPAQEAALLQRLAGRPHIQPSPDMRWHPPACAPAGWPARPEQRPVVLGFGPCGLFAALALAQMGLKPLVLERGRPVRQRTADTWGLWRRQQLQPESNVQFGEGGAGLFSDGKLYSQIKDPRWLGRKVLQEFVAAGAPPEILYQAHPHIGTFRLVKVVQALREQIIALGGEIRFEQRVSAVLLQPDEPAHAAPGHLPPVAAAPAPQALRLRGVRIHDQTTGAETELPCARLVLALGHSARDTFAMLHDAGVALQAKAFSIGVRIEHPQSLIDRARWGRHAGHPLLGAADYKLVHHARNGRAVYSFCMCPGGTVVAATSETGRVVTNGMSQYSRQERNANAGLVVAIEPRDFPQDFPAASAAWEAAFGPQRGVLYAQQAQALAACGHVHPLAGVVLQRDLEARAFVAGGSNYCAPGQRVADLLAQRPSSAFGSVQPSYQPGVHPTDLASVLPDYVLQALREALPAFGRQIRGFDLPDAVLTGVETRTSSPLRIPRGDDYQSLNVRGLYPAGEGAGYAGGILSAAVDGIRVAEALACHALGQPAPAPDRGARREAVAYG